MHRISQQGMAIVDVADVDDRDPIDFSLLCPDTLAHIFLHMNDAFSLGRVVKDGH